MAEMYVNIPKDLDEMKIKVLNKFTKRQLAYICIGVAVGGIIYWTTDNIYLMFVLALPIFCLGFYDRKGMAIERKIIIMARFWHFSSIRKYRAATRNQLPPRWYGSATEEKKRLEDIMTKKGKGGGKHDDRSEKDPPKSSKTGSAGAAKTAPK